MKTFSKLFEGKQLDVQENSLNYIAVPELEQYLEVAKNFLSDESRKIINYMIKHNDTYVKELGGKNSDDSTNCIITFFAHKKPASGELREIYDAIKTLDTRGRLLEIPTLQTSEQFKGIISGNIAPDSIILDLVSEQGRNEVVKKYTPLVNKIVHQWLGKVNMTRDELTSAAFEGLTFAMNNYGKKKKYDDDMDEQAVKTYTFGQFAAYMIRFSIASDVNNNSRVVRIPISAISKEKREKGSIAKNNTVSGDSKMGDDENGKTMFDYVGGVDTSTRDIDEADLERLWQDVYKILEKEFDTKVIEAWYSFMGLNGRVKEKNKKIAERIGCQPSLITYYCNTVNNFIKNNKTIMKKMTDIYELMKECLHEREHDNDLIEEGLAINDSLKKYNENE